uniref:Uncharacterized protein n=1 Tax=Physcomitrium patens TaxID=3218 RepID=A0A2K1J370_PHYPA|nr:hypothetical protein PHYPA_021822 [Physcomitrium patens]
MFGASCFIECSESGVDCFTISCKILEQLNEKSKPKDIEEAQDMLKSFFIKNKIILVLDDVKEQSQIEDIVAMDALSKSIAHFGVEFVKINIHELDEETSMRFFITHSYGYQETLPNELVEVGNEIIKSCNGIPLSLKIMDVFLSSQKRLKKRRDLDGDKSNTDHKIWDILKVSFDNLKNEEKSMFLDICCFFGSDVCLQGMLKERAL